MCHFVSWIEFDGEVYWMKPSDLATKEGKALTKYLGPAFDEDIIGHGAIDHFYSLKGRGKHLECEDLSSPKNFPEGIALAIKAGNIIHRGKLPLNLLSQRGKRLFERTCKADADREKADADWKKADADWKKADADREKAGADWKKAYADRKKADADWKKAYADWKKADADWKKAYADREKADADWKKADADREKAGADWKKAYADRKKADADREKAGAKVFWRVFSDVKNRALPWK